MAINNLDVFINCPFDDQYKPIFNAIVYTVVRSGFRARCALETANAAENRLGKIQDIIEACKYGVHDISRTEADGDPPLPRFNMPLELGLFIGARRFGGPAHRGKACIVFDRERFRYQKFISDIAGQDIHAHGGDVRTLIRELAAWFRQTSERGQAPGGQAIADEYETFEKRLPDICRERELGVEELTFGDFNEIVTVYVAALAKFEPRPAPA